MWHWFLHPGENFAGAVVVYKPVYGLSPSVELGMVWRRDDSGAVLHSFLRVVRDSVQSERSAGEDEERQRRLDPS